MNVSDPASRTHSHATPSVPTPPVETQAPEVASSNSTEEASTADSTTNAPATDATQAPQQAVLPVLASDVTRFVQRFFPNDGLVFINGDFWGYNAGYWRRLEERPEVRRKVCEFLAPAPKASEVNNLMNLLRDSQSRRSVDCLPNRRMICLKNGTLDTDARIFIEHSPQHWLRTHLEVDWDPQAQCPRWLLFLKEVFVNDADSAAKIAFVQEWFGYCLVPDTSQHKFVWMVGYGGNGKSVLLSVLTELVGNANVSHAHLDRLDRACVRAEIENKLVNISSEMAAGATIADSYLKSIVGGDMIEAERKYKDSSSFRPYARLIAATNDLPRLSDTSDGFFRRAIILTFNRRFGEDEQDTNLVSTLKAELPGILRWAMLGLDSLRDRGHFDFPPSSIAALTEYRTDSDVIGQFVEECLEPTTDRNCLVLAREIYALYRKWATAHGHPCVTDAILGKKLKQHAITSVRNGGRTYRIVKLRAEGSTQPPSTASPSDPVPVSVPVPSPASTVPRITEPLSWSGATAGASAQASH